LDLTRILAGPVATRFLAAYGADILRIDPPDWDEPAVLPEVTIGKRRARLDLNRDVDRTIFEKLLSEADVIVHGYRADALDGLGYGTEARQAINPDLIDVALNAYGWTGPWSVRRGFDTIVQMSAGLAFAEMQQGLARSPQQLAVQALDYGTGHMMAAAVIRALCEAQRGTRSHIRFSLARTAHLLAQWPAMQESQLLPEQDLDLQSGFEETYWGPSQRLKPPLQIDGIPFVLTRPAGPLGSDNPSFGSNS
jgi:crotonobetainyl-CoA:carnitine CoA-transferase CaiB-like acyl-CoA transferase